ncbi:endolytic transglycosylase MltG [Candidatus Woesebacteria bacterium]|nr:endolytic transglycosylase MltG [Candidatus Woesebacteria bacterium]
MQKRINSILVVVLVILGLMIVSAAGAVFWFRQQLAPVNPADQTQELFVIKKGSSTSVVAKSLAEKGLIRNDTVFRLYARAVGFDRDLQAGSYTLSPALSVADTIAALRKGSVAIWVTIPEGLRVEEVADRFSSAALPSFDKQEFINIAKPSEGRLFPDTYLIPRESTAKELFDLLTRTFQDKVEIKLADALQASDRPFDQTLVLASLVQRESNSPSDMRIVAGIMSNRLALGMKLDIDATLSYARGFDSQAGSWWSAPNPQLKSIDSPYNTYLVAGLPPAPIANPGLEAIQAALDPTATSALFYLHSSTGQAYYADTYEEHLANIERYLR